MTINSLKYDANGQFYGVQKYSSSLQTDNVKKTTVDSTRYSAQIWHLYVVTVDTVV